MPDYSIVELINNQMPEVTASVNLTLSRPSSGGGSYQDGLPDPSLDPYFPEQGYLTEEACFLKFRAFRPTLAYIRGVNGEVPTDREVMELSMERIGSLLIAKGREFTEDDFKLRRKIQMMIAAGMGAAAQELLDTFLAVPAQLTIAWTATLRMLAQRVAVAGKALYTDTNTLIPVELDYTSQIPSGHLATTKTGNGRWSQPTTADGTADLVEHLNAVYQTLRMFPPAIVMGSTEADQLRSQNSTRIKSARLKGLLSDSPVAPTSEAAQLPRPTLQDVQDVIASELTSAAQTQGASPPQLLVTDAIWYRRLRNGTLESGPYLPSGYYHFCWNRFIECARFPTATNNFQNTIAIATKREEYPPVMEKVAVDGGAIPIVSDPRYIAARNVQNTALT